MNYLQIFHSLRNFAGGLNDWDFSGLSEEQLEMFAALCMNPQGNTVLFTQLMKDSVEGDSAWLAVLAKFREKVAKPNMYRAWVNLQNPPKPKMKPGESDSSLVKREKAWYSNATYLLQIHEASRNAGDFVDYYNSTMNPERSLVANLAKTMPMGQFIQAAWDPYTMAIEANLVNAGFPPKVALGFVAEHNGVMMASLTYGMPMTSRWNPNKKVCPPNAMSIWLLVVVDRKTGEVRTYHSWEIGRVHTVTPDGVDEETKYFVLQLSYYGMVFLFDASGRCMGCGAAYEADEITLQSGGDPARPLVLAAKEPVEMTWLSPESGEDFTTWAPERN